MKIAIITDIHHSAKPGYRGPGWDGVAVMEAFVDHATSQGADLILDLGDHIVDIDRSADIRLATEVATVLGKFKGPRYHLLGNHDVVNLSIADNEDIFGQSMAHQAIDLGPVRLILWQPGVSLPIPGGFAPAAPALQWLIETLAASSKPAIIATHAPLSGQSQIGNHYFENNAQYATYPDHAMVRQAVEATGNAALWLSGHVHWNSVTTIAGITYMTIQSMSERYTTMPKVANAFAMLDISDGSAELSVYGNDPFGVRLPFSRSADRTWLKPIDAEG